MIRNLKALGLALMAVLALGAVAASAASAQNFQGELTSTGNAEVTLFATENAGGVNSLTAFGTGIKCPGSTYTGHAALTYAQTTAGSKHTLIKPPATEITLTPHYNQEACVDSSGREATVEMGNCDYDLKIGTTTTSAHTYGLSAKITCHTATDKIHVGIWAEGNTAHTASRLCTVEVGEQEISGAHITDNTNGTLTAKGTLGGLKVERHGLCLLDGKGTTTTAGEFHLDANVEGKNAKGEKVNLSLSEIEE